MKDSQREIQSEIDRLRVAVQRARSEAPVDALTGLAEQMRATEAAGRIRRGEPLPSTERVTLSRGVTQFILGDSDSEFFKRAERAL